MYTYLVSLHKWLYLGPHFPKFGPLVAEKWLKIVLSNHYLQN